NARPHFKAQWRSPRVVAIHILYEGEGVVHATDYQGVAFQRRVTYCARNGPLPLLPSGPGGVGGIVSRRTRHFQILSLTSGRIEAAQFPSRNARLWIDGCIWCT